MKPVAALLALLAFSPPAHAEALDQAKAAFAAGKAAFERGDYETALMQFQRANLIAPAPTLTYNIGATYERLGRYQDAALAFDRYLEQMGPPQNDEERRSQENLRARAEADRRRAAAPTAPAPPAAPAPPPPNYYSPYSPIPYYAPPPGPTREQRLGKARAQHARAIALVVVGGVLTLGGVGILLDGLLDAHGQYNTVTMTNDFNGWNYFEDFIGGSCIIVGATLWIPGAVSWVSSDHKIQELSRPEPAAAAPHAWLFHSPVFRF
jgi:hypothetical protein